jgi:hypothetical protein
MASGALAEIQHGRTERDGRLLVGPVEPWLAGHATLLDDCCGPILVQTYPDVSGIEHNREREMITRAEVVWRANEGEPPVRVGIIQCPLVMTPTGKQGQYRHANGIWGHGKVQVERWNVMLMRP